MKKTIQTTTIILTLFLAVFSCGLSRQAQAKIKGPDTPDVDVVGTEDESEDSEGPTGVTNPILQGKTGSDLTGAESGSLFFAIISGLLRFMMFLGAILTLINLVQAGIDWIGSGGDSGKIEKARNRLTNALIGLIILSASFAIWTFIRQFLGIDLGVKLLFPQN